MEEVGFETKAKKFGIDSFTLKIIAVVSMVIDHYAAIVYPMSYGGSFANMPPSSMQIYMLLRMVGRIAFPIFAYLIAEGFIKTKNAKNYAKRLFIFALISTPAYNIAFGQTFIYTKKFLISFIFGNVMWTFFFSIIMLYIIKKIEEKRLNVVVKIILIIATFAIFYFIGNFTMCDRKGLGILTVGAFYLFRKNKPLQFVAGAIPLYYQNIVSCIAFIPLAFYNGKRGKDYRYFFYTLYPAHLFIFALIRFAQYGVGTFIK